MSNGISSSSSSSSGVGFDFSELLYVLDTVTTYMRLTAQWRGRLGLGSGLGIWTGGGDANMNTKAADIDRNTTLVIGSLTKLATQLNNELQIDLHSTCLYVPTMSGLGLGCGDGGADIQLEVRGSVSTDTLLVVPVMLVVTRVLQRLNACHENVMSVLTQSTDEGRSGRSLYALVDVVLLVDLLTALRANMQSHRHSICSILQYTGSDSTGSTGNNTHRSKCIKLYISIYTVYANRNLHSTG